MGEETAEHFVAVHLRASVRRLLGRDDIDSADANGVTALYWSVRKGHEGVMDILIGARADLDGANDRGWTPLIVAAIYGRSSMVRKLLVAGANHRLADQDGRTALDYAQYGSAASIRAMCRFGSGGAWVTGSGRDAWYLKIGLIDGSFYP